MILTEYERKALALLASGGAAKFNSMELLAGVLVRALCEIDEHRLMLERITVHDDGK